jgi:uncharacterized membrane protein
MCSSSSIIAMDVFVGFLGLFWIREGVGESLAPEVLYFLCAFILFMLARDAIICIVYFQRSNLVACCPNKVFLVRETSGY